MAAPEPIIASVSVPPMRIVAVLVHYGEPSRTMEAVRALQQSARPPDAVVVVDNSSDFPDVDGIDVARPGRNVGYGAGANLGVERARADGADAVLLMNNDCIVDGDALLRLEQVMEGDDRIGCAAPLVRNLDGSVQSAGASISGWTGRPRPADGVEVQAASGACLLLRVAALGDVGGFDERYFCYWEETDWFERLRPAPWKVVVERRAEVRHERGAAAPSTFMAFEYALNQRLFLSLHRTGVASVAANALALLLTAARAARDLAGGRTSLAVAAARGALARLPRTAEDARATAAMRLGNG